MVKKTKEEEGAGNAVSAFEVRREIMHLLTGIIIISLVILLKNKAMWLLFFALIFGITISLLSLNYRIPFFSYLLNKFERPHYRKKFPGKGLLFYVAGSLLVLKLFSSNQDIALAAIAILTLGDSASHIIGMTKKQKPNGFSKKSIWDTIAGIIAGTVGGSIFISLPYALIGAIIAMTAENFSLKVGFEEVDDNIIVPLIAGTAIYLLLKI